jgi:4-amino-4-deoxy-L-arabinose transferase-like glycosyltransferase
MIKSKIIDSRVPYRLIVLLIVAWGVLTFRLAAPWFGIQDASQVWVASAVRNYHLYGVENTTLLVTFDSAPVENNDFTFYSHHPPLIAWIPAVITQFTGYHELGVRFAFAAASLISVCAIYVLARRLYNEKIAFWTAFFYAFTPMVAYFGRVTGHEAFGLAAALLFTAVLVNWLRRPNRLRYLALILLVWLSVWTAWLVVFFVGALGFVAMWIASRQQRIAIIGLGAWTIIAFVVMMLFYEAQWWGAFEDLLDAFVWRTSNSSGRREEASFTVIQFIIKNIAHILFFITPTLTFLSLWGIRYVRRYSSRQTKTVLAGLLLAAFAYLIVFRNANYIHDYYKIVFVPAMAISSATVMYYAHTERRMRRWVRPATRVLVGAMIVTSVLVVGVMHLTGHQPRMQAIIDALNAEISPDDVVISFIDDDVYGYDNVIQFYTFHAVHWQQTPDNALATAATGDNRVWYVYCIAKDGAFPEELDAYVSTPIYEDECRLYILKEI